MVSSDDHLFYILLSDFCERICGLNDNNNNFNTNLIKFFQNIREYGNVLIDICVFIHNLAQLYGANYEPKNISSIYPFNKCLFVLFKQSAFYIDFSSITKCGNNNNCIFNKFKSLYYGHAHSIKFMSFNKNNERSHIIVSVTDQYNISLYNCLKYCSTNWLTQYKIIYIDKEIILHDDVQNGGSSYFKKYLKYKTKYIKYKNDILFDN